MLDTDFAPDIAAFEALVASHRADHAAPWVVMFKGILKASFATYTDAVDYAVQTLPLNEFFIGDINETQVQVPLVVL